MKLRSCLLLGFLAASACKTETKRTPAPSASSLAAASALPSPQKAAIPDVDLLTWTDAKVVVSSKVDNPHDFPEHLCDGKPETAWNGKTGDLHASIDVALPAGALAHSIGIVVGFDRKKTGKSGTIEDLFLENYRIKKLRIIPDNGTAQEVDLSINKREMQRIMIAPAKKFGSKSSMRCQAHKRPGVRSLSPNFASSELPVRPGWRRRALRMFPSHQSRKLRPNRSVPSPRRR